ncbi:SDR family NAD(P)-dependent oxidoreductase [Paraurantiacibacter namhicola]|uniref:C-factor n=1 Tax=Paraurantiacibacter namhicola TaxID=645517 RepID=A0A1C7D9B6_9SPHN|nr:SDR family NAD(P)-dependent oxidoreductase [Paraurantiacibacter namhicola]ANU07911.1 C-factor [Paraurantiacibacter namhicola]
MSWHRAAVIGASGGIGAALCDALEARGCEVVRFNRSGENAIDLSDEASIAAAADGMRDSPPDLVLVASGVLHVEGAGPEKSFRDLSPDQLAAYFAINAAGPALVAKHFLPLFPRDSRAAFAAIGARVGSITDNGLGGWYGYRASKAALAMLVKTLSIELGRTHKQALCVALHPGTVDTKLSEPFQGNVPEGKLFTPEKSAGAMLDVLDGLGPQDSGGHFAWDGQRIAP